MWMDYSELNCKQIEIYSIRKMEGIRALGLVSQGYFLGRFKYPFTYSLIGHEVISLFPVLTYKILKWINLPFIHTENGELFNWIFLLNNNWKDTPWKIPIFKERTWNFRENSTKHYLSLDANFWDIVVCRSSWEIFWVCHLSPSFTWNP